MGKRVLSEGKIGRFCVEDVLLENGHEARFEVLYHPGAAAVLPLLDDDRVLLLRQYRHPIRAWLWEIPAGKLDSGEDSASCAMRELEEETGYRATALEPLGTVLTAPGFTDELIRLYVARGLEPGTLGRGPGEQIELHQLRFDAVMKMIERGEINDAKTLAALFRYLLGGDSGPKRLVGRRRDRVFENR